MFERLNFRMWRLRKELVNELGITILTSCVYCTSEEMRIYLIHKKIGYFYYLLLCNSFMLMQMEAMQTFM